MKQTLLLALTTLCSFIFAPSLYAQSYRPGFIVKAEGDTIQGLIKYREGKGIYRACVFKPAEKAPSQKYTPSDIVAYGIHNDAMFESHTFTNNKNKETKAFLEVLVHGKLSLYEYQNMLFVSKDRDTLQRLAVKVNDPGIGGIVGEIRTTTASTKHLILLNSLTMDCPVPDELLAEVVKKINTPNAVAIVEAYNKCAASASNITYKQHKPWLTFDKGLFIGSHTTDFAFAEGPNSVHNTNFPVRSNVVIGGHLNLVSPRRSEKLSLQVDALFSKEQYQGYLEVQRPLTIHRTDFDIDITRFSAVIMGRYTTVRWKQVKPYLAFGASNNFILNSKAKRRFESETTINNIKQVDTFLSEATINMGYYTGATAAVGTTYLLHDKYKLLFQLRYERSVLFANREFSNDDFTVHLNSNNSFYITAAYIFR
ncbi:hypothetical protein WG947_11740 [Pontibacter sp. H259]|uniref:hypothetical protein n=1 Tax=Pontibacter sp. H259 TaxID=3133421 RepID=UPI0030BB73D6